MLYVVVSNDILVPSPANTVSTLYHLVADGTRFRLAVSASLQTLIYSWSIGISVVILLSWATTLHRSLNDGILYVSSMFQVLPTFSMLPIFILLFGLGDATVHAMILWSMLWASVIHLSGRTQAVYATWAQQIQNLQLSNTQKISKVYVPGLIPDCIATMKLSWGLSWRTLIAVELLLGTVGSNYGLGAIMTEYRTVYDTSEVWAVLVTIAILGITANTLFDNARRYFEY